MRNLGWRFLGRAYPASAPEFVRQANEAVLLGRRDNAKGAMSDETIGFWAGLRAWLICSWDHVAWLARALWACRVSVLSGLAGVILFSVAVPAQNLFADQSFTGPWQVLYWLGVFALVFLVWAFPIHYNARRTLDRKAWLLPYRFRAHFDRDVSKSVVRDLRRRHAFLIEWMPRLVALLPFVAVLFGLWGAWDALEGAGALPQAVEARTQLNFLFVLNLITASLFFAFLVYRQPLLQRAQDQIDARRPNTDRRRKTETALEWFYRVSAVLTLLVFIVAYFWPEVLANRAPRAMLTPLLLGSLVLFLGWIAREGDRRGFPALAALILISVLVTGLNTRFNDVRVLALSNSEQAKDRQIDFPEAVKNWRAANGCADPSPVSSCPPALIVAAEGGASRAAFMTATVIGHLMDRDGDLGDGPDLKSPGRRIFAISGVSGGSLGAVVIRAAIEDSFTKPDMKPPCANDQRNWFQKPVGGADPKTSWRACLQLLVSGDYLSSAFVGFGFRDNFAPPGLGILDRAALLEQAWERHYDYVVNEPASLSQIGRDCDARSRQGLCRPFGYAKASAPKTWAPLLLLNGTSVNSGRRIVVSDLVSTRPNKNRQGRVPLYSAAFDFFEMTSSGCLVGKDHDKDKPDCQKVSSGPDDILSTLRDGPDIRLSTAALMSARFPILSPAGVIRVTDRAGFGDRVVDGGYFENAGFTTALDVANALKAEGITPSVLWIGNEPITPPGQLIYPPRAAVSPPVTSDDDGYRARVLGLAEAPVDTLIATRSGHEYEEADLVDSDLHKMNRDVCGASFYQVGVRADVDLTWPPRNGKQINCKGGAEQAPAEYWSDPILNPACEELAASLDAASLDKGKFSMTKVSMSWWLASAVQADLDAQLCDGRNRATFRDLIAWLHR
jgi:hypothetical protein